MCVQNWKFVASTDPEIIRGTQKISAVPGYAHAHFSPKFLRGFCSDGPCELYLPNVKFVALRVPEYYQYDMLLLIQLQSILRLCCCKHFLHFYHLNNQRISQQTAGGDKFMQNNSIGMIDYHFQAVVITLSIEKMDKFN